ncbi:hypothetical protein K503DRAFT_765875 [Rhizopogon vinicolor AM-OR11-026]|uniref:Uncharacterized protein n=1 Tax=Rhizopogon vinicolor AM-OR11-026 TaxID=1314800 RepID=A0A1B7NF96_9AGAM|nr:hypothetical protein K503DRAFT_765875 [Rhizopogon vinicolor AM-OR11-026]
MEKGLYDLCIDDSTQVTRLTSHEWSTIEFEAGMTIVMRIIIVEQRMVSSWWSAKYRCSFCKLIYGSSKPRTRSSIDCQVCGRRFQVSTTPEIMEGITQPSIDSDQETADMDLIRNFHVKQTEPQSMFSGSTLLPLASRRQCPLRV